MRKKCTFSVCSEIKTKKITKLMIGKNKNVQQAIVKMWDRMMTKEGGIKLLSKERYLRGEWDLTWTRKMMD